MLSVMSQSELGRRVGKKPQKVSHWFKGTVPGEEVLRTSEALEWRVTPPDLRPDLYPNPDDSLPKTKAA
ncbi:YdaS family helix-turn-helix protein [Escherichia coli]|nr:YdaS family helix-turn-helix protein [Escherichia coli]